MPVAGSSLEGAFPQTESLPNLARSGDFCWWRSATPVHGDFRQASDHPVVVVAGEGYVLRREENFLGGLLHSSLWELSR